MNVIAQLCQERDRARQTAEEKTRRLQELMLEYVSAIAEATANAARLDQMIATLQQGGAYPVGPGRPDGRGRAEAPARSTRSRGREPRRPAQAPAPYVPGAVARVILEALAKAGEKGLSARAVNETVELAGYTLDASEKNKTRLKKNNLVRHDEKAQHWYPISPPNGQSPETGT